MAATNTIDPTVAKRWFGEVMRVYDDLEAQTIDNMNACKAIRGRLPDIYESAKAAGISTKALKAQVKMALEDRKIEKCEARKEAAYPTDEEDQETFEMLRDALGDFGDSPLGAAALNAKEAKGGKGGKTKNGAAAKDDDDKDLRPRHLQEAERQRIEENTARLEKGISGLPGADATEA